MIGLEISRTRAQALFFDRPQVKRAVDRATARALSRSGGMIRITARRSIRRRKRASAPGQPPSSPTGVLRESIFYAFDPRKRSVAIGPVRLGRRAGDGGSAGTVPALLEGGGRVRRKRRTIRYQPRPFMGPAFRNVKRSLPRQWANSVR